MGETEVMRKIIIEVETDSDWSIEQIKQDLQQEIRCCSNWFDVKNMSVKEETHIEGHKSQKIGKWIKNEKMSIVIDIWECSRCNGEGARHYKFCPTCGFRMEGGDADADCD